MMKDCGVPKPGQISAPVVAQTTASVADRRDGFVNRS
jgi:hypothetical protein